MKIFKYFFLVFGIILVLFLSLYYLGLRVNISESIPYGFYWVVSDGKIKTEDYIDFCPPENSVFKKAFEKKYFLSGFCPSGYAKLMKKIAAMPGDKVTINEKGIWVNDQFLKNSKPLSVGFSTLNIESEVLDKNQVLLYTNNPASFDSRYFGLIDMKYILYSVEPFFTWR